MFKSAVRRQTPESEPRRRARGPIALGSVAAATFLSACGLVAAFVPPLSVGDPLGVEGQSVSATLEEGGLAAQSSSHLDETRSFDVADLEEDLRGFSLAGFHTNAGLANQATLTGPAGSAASDHPGSFTITRAVVEAELWDEVNGRVVFARDMELALPFDRSECSANKCAYSYAGSEALEDVLNVELTDRDALERLVSVLILRESETPNHGTFRVAVEADLDLSGFTASFTLTSDGSTIRLGG